MSYQKKHAKYSRAYRARNRSKISAANKSYYARNKAIIAAKRKQKRDAMRAKKHMLAELQQTLGDSADSAATKNVAKNDPVCRP